MKHQNLWSTPPIPTTHSSDTKRGRNKEKQQQSIITQHDQSENTEDEELCDAELFSSKDASYS
jgi:hypothetical protein